MSKKLVTREIPDILLVTEKDLSYGEVFILIHRFEHNVGKPFVICRRGRETILINSELPDIMAAIDLINKIMAIKYLDRAADLFDKFEQQYGKDASKILLCIWMDWRKEVQDVDRHKRGMDALGEINKSRLIKKAQKDSDIIKELFDIGFGLYDDSAKCDISKGAEYAYAYGYAQGMKVAEAQRKARAAS